MRTLRQLAGPILIDLDRADPASTIFIAGMGRSGTTWLANIINHAGTHRTIFEPFWNQRVRAVRGFERVQYERADDVSSPRAEVARRILAGRVRSRWTDQENRVRFARSRIIKDIRANLMLKWLSKLRPGMPIVLIIRHPLAIMQSWKRLQWGMGPGGTKDLASILSQRPLFDDFPIIETVRGRVDLDDYLDHMVFLWCVQYLVPMRQLDNDERIVIQYEQLLLDPETEARRILSALNVPIDAARLESALRRSSSTNVLGSDVSGCGEAIADRWRDDVTATQIDRADEILAMFAFKEAFDPARDLIR